ncbi:primosomal protein N' (replication factor Y) - superfamily II helicase [Alkalilacustris brevis]|uniref:primosomal protein N' (replication factor Y) - superfamily II helicase n=1 Tax=Alkalilacustris brevis TaxID=2026338 RepID=UPI000E0DE53C|nr:primosomal protein N' (replication factor Y) - superfamily II helicase [Alkalilacustris brevis]
MPETPSQTRQEHRFPCARCGANLRYAPGQISMRCSYCGHQQEIPGVDDATRKAAMRPLDLHKTLGRALPEQTIEETRVLSCPNCGAQVEFDRDVHSAECPFCATPVVTDTGKHRHIKPQAVLPFTLTEADARAAFRKWLAGLWFAPNGLKKFARRDHRLAGVYVPYWAFDADTRSQYHGERGTYYYTGTGKRRRRRTRWRRVSGQVSRRFENLLIMASRSLPRRYVRALEPWHLDALEAYDPQFIAGFRAEGYTVALDEGHGLAQERMDEIIREDVRRDIGGDAQRIHSLDTTTANERFRHLLLPLWVAAYRYRGESYRFVVNAQTGKVRGERPWSAWKIAFAVLAGLLALAGFAYLTEVM